MLTIQVTLMDKQTQALRAIAQRTGKTEKEVIVEAVEQFIAQPDVNTLREESGHYSTFNETQLEADMTEATPLTALRYNVLVTDEGHVELHVPFPHGVRVVVYVIEEPAADLFTDLLAAASTSLDFWDNALDDEELNNA